MIQEPTIPCQSRRRRDWCQSTEVQEEEKEEMEDEFLESKRGILQID